MAEFSIRFAKREDCGLILGFIKELAKYEKMLDDVVATEELLNEWIFEKEKAEVEGAPSSSPSLADFDF